MRSPYSSPPMTRPVGLFATCDGANATRNPSRLTSTMAMRVDGSDEAFFDWIVSKRWMPADAQLHAFEYGIEIAETNGKNLTFAVTDFSVSGN